MPLKVMVQIRVVQDVRPELLPCEVCEAETVHGVFAIEVPAGSGNVIRKAMCCEHDDDDLVTLEG